MRGQVIRFLAGIAMLLMIFLNPGCKSRQQGPAEAPEFKVMALKGSSVPIFLDMVGQAEGIPTIEIRARVEGY